MGALNLIDQDGQHLGSVAEIILDIASGCVIAVTLRLPNTLASSQMVVIPWDSLRFDREYACLRLVPEGDDAQYLYYEGPNRGLA